MSQHPIMEKLAAKLQRHDLPRVNAPSGDTVRVQVKDQRRRKRTRAGF